MFQFGGIPYPVLPGAKPPSPWFADLRYTFATPLPHSYPNVYDEVIKSDRVDSAIEVEEVRTPDVSVYKIKRKVKKFYYEIRATLSRFICKICGYVLYKVFRRLMTRLLVCPQQMERLVEAEKVTSVFYDGFDLTHHLQTGIPLVYLPLHRSHLDYLLITWASWLLRATGAFFIHRRVDEHDETGKDAIYRAVLHSYIEQVLKKGMCIEFFLEGTRLVLLSLLLYNGPT
ncbi:unnamed protein product [Cylicostephanus goldi]|uniref:Phospholipid/glycerol acyltransferase domain-containing protein n=1 Tax=Cylicostephanus goldi TaxID=71465 RepID=A0A3P7M0A0_CYLGO|nr:unnamed protein product [Cylicostephanus goldi]